MTTADATRPQADTRSVRVTFWGPLTDAVSMPERIVTLRPGATARDVAATLASSDAALGEALGAKGVLVMADDALIDWDTDVSSMREVAFMSPMSGG